MKFLSGYLVKTPRIISFSAGLSQVNIVFLTEDIQAFSGQPDNL